MCRAQLLFAYSLMQFSASLLFIVSCKSMLSKLRAVKRRKSFRAFIATYSYCRCLEYLEQNKCGKKFTPSRELSASLFLVLSSSFPDICSKGNKSVKLNMSLCYYCLHVNIVFVQQCKDTQLF